MDGSNLSCFVPLAVFKPITTWLTVLPYPGRKRNRNANLLISKSQKEVEKRSGVDKWSFMVQSNIFNLYQGGEYPGKTTDHKGTDYLLMLGCPRF